MNPTPARQAYEQAMRLHRGGRLAEAEALYRQALALGPDDADALFMFGLLNYQTGRLADATTLIRRAIAVIPTKAVYHAHLGTVLLATGNVVEAIRSFHEAIRLNPASAEAHSNLAGALVRTADWNAALGASTIAVQLRPDFAEAHYNRGIALLRLNRADGSIEHFRRATELRPNYADALNGLGAALQTIGRFDEAITLLQHAVALQPSLVEAMNNLGNALKNIGRREEAIAAFRQSLAIQPNAWDVRNNLGVALQEAGSFDEAIDQYSQALRTNPNQIELLYNLANTLKAKGALQEAADAYRRAIALKPDYFEAHNNLGIVLREAGRLDEAVAAFRAALAIRPNAPEALNLGNALAARGDIPGFTAVFEHLLADHPSLDEARLDFSLALLQYGYFERGWKEYEARLRVDRFGSARKFNKPQWDGSDLHGRHILLHTEQGLGDAIQFIRYAPMVKARGGMVSLLCRPELERLLSEVVGIDNVLTDGQPAIPFDVHCPLMSLPKAFGTTVETIPAKVPYLTTDPAQVEAWKRRLNPFTKKRVGLVWAGGQPHSRRRSMPLALCRPLTTIPDIQLFSLQKGGDDVRDKAMIAGMGIIDWTDELRDFTDTAAFVECLDLVITVDTAMVHIPGGLAKPVWIMLPLDADWRWLTHPTHTPWYPTAKLFRQKPATGWEGVISDVVSALNSSRRIP